MISCNDDFVCELEFVEEVEELLEIFVFSLVGEVSWK